jgi:hypothetical protein
MDSVHGHGMVAHREINPKETGDLKMTGMNIFVAGRREDIRGGRYMVICLWELDWSQMSYKNALAEAAREDMRVFMLPS